jgi:hypothetical protein
LSEAWSIGVTGAMPGRALRDWPDSPRQLTRALVSAPDAADPRPVCMQPIS